MKLNKTDANLRDWTYEEEKEVLLNSVVLELSVEVSESNLTLDEIIDIIHKKYPHYHFDRTAAKYESCVMAVFVYQP